MCFDKNSIKIIQAHPLFVAICKPAGVPFQRVGEQAGALELLRELEASGELPKGERLYPVHRIDKVTSGILLFARGRKQANELGNHFRYGRINKIYVALSDRVPKKKQGLISGDMEKGRRGSWILLRTKYKPAITRFKSFAIKGRRSGLRLFVVKPKTGRTHQIRVALKSISAPILGDALYSRYDLARTEERAYLHAAAIQFSLAGETFTIKDTPSVGSEFQSQSFINLWQGLGDPFKLFDS